LEAFVVQLQLLWFTLSLRRREMKKSYLVTAVAALLALSAVASAFAVEPYLLRESENGDPGQAGTPCLLTGNTNGTAANYRWYNACANYIWIFTAWVPGEGLGVLYGGVGNEAVNGDNDVKRTITYFRNVVQNYNQTVDVYVSASTASGCITSDLASDLDLDPGLRWNCSEFGVEIPCGTEYVIVRQQHDGGAAPSFATDGPFKNTCDPNPPQRTFYYGVNGSACVPWAGQTDAWDNLFNWLILDTSEPCITAVESRSWGNIKGLYQ
jgi:hypothetical protein